MAVGVCQVLDEELLRIREKPLVEVSPPTLVEVQRLWFADLDTCAHLPGQ